MKDFREDLEQLINFHSLESNSGTPDFILAEFLMNILKVFDSTMKERDKWHHGPDAFSESESVDESV